MKEYIAVFAHTLGIYLFLVVAVRVTGRRQLGQLTSLDLAILVLMGSAVQTAMLAGAVSLAAGLVSAATLLLANRAITLAVSRSKRVRHLLCGGPVVLVHDGQIVEENLKRCGFTESDLMEALRERETERIDQVQYAVLETDGAVHVVRR